MAKFHLTWLVWNRSQPDKDMKVEDMLAALQVLEMYADLVSMVYLIMLSVTTQHQMAELLAIIPRQMVE